MNEHVTMKQVKTGTFKEKEPLFYFVHYKTHHPRKKKHLCSKAMAR
jgi:hypothetical protein